MIVLSTVSFTGLMLLDKNSRPKKSAMLYALGGFMIILLLATLNSINPTRSMWSNFERMEGFVTMLYMAALFVVASSTLRYREWPWVMNTSIVISIVVGIQALSTATTSADRISGYLGNSTYLGVYALIHIFFGLLGAAMIFRGNRERELLDTGEHKTAHKLSMRNYTHIAVYLFVVIFNALILFKTGTRGAFVGLVIGLILSSIYLSWKEKNKIIRYGAMGFLVAVLLSVSFLGIFKNSAVVQNSNQLNRFAALVTTDYKSVLKNQGEARTMIWRMAFKGVKERPLLGWGQDNFGYVFAKYYNPDMYGQEQWFDRSHNVFMDWLIAGGVLGLLGYLSLFATALYFIFSKRSKFTVIEKALWLGALAAYFVHNIFVFDNLSSYVLFFLILAYINDRYTHDRHEAIEHKALSENEINKIILISIVSAIVLIFIAYQTVLKPYTQNKSIINILQSSQNVNELNKVDTNFKNVLNLGPTGKFEAFEQLSTYLPKILALKNVSTTTKQNLVTVFEESVKEYDKKISDDSRYNYFVSNTYQSLGVNDKALEYMNKAYDLSPKKQSFAYAKALILLNGNNLNEVISVLKKAYEDAPQNLAAFGYYTGMLAEKAKADNYSFVSINNVAVALVEGYTKNGHDMVLKKELWDLFTDKRVKAILANRVIELLPEKRLEILEVSK
jgi:O-antigen ligase